MNEYLPKGDNDIERALMGQVALGQEARQFLAGNLSTYICERAEQKTIEAQNALSTVDPTDTKEIIRLQTEIARFAHFTRCLQEMVTAGDSAYQAYLAEHETD